MSIVDGSVTETAMGLLQSIAKEDLEPALLSGRRIVLCARQSVNADMAVELPG